MEENNCLICEESLNSKFVHKLDCNHKFHYECLIKSYKYQKINKCPYCRQTSGLLPLVNGIKKPQKNIHYNYLGQITDNHGNLEYVNKKCNHILTKGKNKGNLCNKYCMIGYYKCKIHK